MKFAFGSLLSLSLAALVAAPALAQDAAAKQEKKAAKKPANAQAFAFPKEIVLTAEQKTKVEELQKEYGPKLADLQKKQTDVLTEEQKTARAAVQKENTAAKKTGKEAQAAVMAALKLTAEQDAKYKEIGKEIAALRKVIDEKKLGLLTDEQKALIPKKKAAK